MSRLWAVKNIAGTVSLYSGRKPGTAPRRGAKRKCECKHFATLSAAGFKLATGGELDIEVGVPAMVDIVITDRLHSRSKENR